MSFPKTIRDRRDTEMVIRPLEPRDLGAYVVLQRAILRAGEGVVLDPDEGFQHADDARAHLGVFFSKDPDDALLLGAFRGRTLCGSADVRRYRQRRLRHVALLSAGIDPAWQGRGLGHLLTREVLDWCDAVGVVRTELHVRADNTRAIQLYERLGFRHDAVREAFIRDPSGAFVDDRIMSRVRLPSGP
jgi:ribosomal protein S18 acetylase RimI-like enzyme